MRNWSHTGGCARVGMQDPIARGRCKELVPVWVPETGVQQLEPKDGYGILNQNRPSGLLGVPFCGTPKCLLGLFCCPLGAPCVQRRHGFTPISVITPPTPPQPTIPYADTVTRPCTLYTDGPVTNIDIGDGQVGNSAGGAMGFNGVDPWETQKTVELSRPRTRSVPPDRSPPREGVPPSMFGQLP